MEPERKIKRIIIGGYLLASFLLAFGISAYIAPLDSFYSKIQLLGNIGKIFFYASFPTYLLTTIVALRTKVVAKKLILPMVIMIISLVIVVLKIVNALIGFIYTTLIT